MLCNVIFGQSMMKSVHGRVRIRFLLIMGTSSTPSSFTHIAPLAVTNIKLSAAPFAFACNFYRDPSRDIGSVMSTLSLIDIPIPCRM